MSNEQRSETALSLLHQGMEFGSASKIIIKQIASTYAVALPKSHQTNTHVHDESMANSSQQRSL